MKKMLLGGLVAAVALGASASTFAMNDSRFYAGVDYTYLSGLDKQTFDLAEKSANLLGVTGGVQFTDFIGLEVSWAHSVQDVSQWGDLDVDFSHFTAGVTGQYPLANNYYAKGLIGATWQKYAFEATGFKAHEHKDGKFLGKIGVGYQVDPNSVVEFTYVREAGLDGLGLQYKYVF